MPGAVSFSEMSNSKAKTHARYLQNTHHTSGRGQPSRGPKSIAVILGGVAAARGAASPTSAAVAPARHATPPTSPTCAAGARSTPVLATAPPPRRPQPQRLHPQRAHSHAPIVGAHATVGAVAETLPASAHRRLAVAVAAQPMGGRAAFAATAADRYSEGARVGNDTREIM